MSPIVVTAAVIERDGAYLVTKRLAGVHLGGLWEFPGGKCEAGEPLDACLMREIREELGCDVDVRHEIFATTHTYPRTSPLEPDRAVELHFFVCELKGEPAPALGQDLRWVPRRELPSLEFPPADHALIVLLSQGTAAR